MKKKTQSKLQYTAEIHQPEQAGANDDVKMLAEELKKWRRRAETLHLMANHNAATNDQTTAMLNATNARLQYVQRFLLSDARMDQIAALVGKPVAACPICGKIFLSNGKAGWGICDECYGNHETAWPDETAWTVTEDGKLVGAMTCYWTYAQAE